MRRRSAAARPVMPEPSRIVVTPIEAALRPTAARSASVSVAGSYRKTAQASLPVVSATTRTTVSSISDNSRFAVAARFTRWKAASRAT